MVRKRQWLSGMVLVVAGAAIGAELTVGLQEAGPAGAGNALGSVRLLETAHGLVFYPALKGLAPGLHGFHVHENGSCAPAMRDGVPIAALAAGGHFDPQRTGKHGEPWGDGHLGDLPALVVATDGSASMPVLAPRMKLSDVRGRALIVHAGGDNHSDQPLVLGGGGARVGCGVISQ